MSANALFGANQIGIVWEHQPRLGKDHLWGPHKRGRPALGLLMTCPLLTPACESDDEDSVADAPVGEQTDDNTAADEPATDEALTIAVSQELPNWDLCQERGDGHQDAVALQRHRDARREAA